MNKKRKKNKINKKERKIATKLILSIVYLTVITILGICSFRIFKETEMDVSWSNVKNSNQYTYMYISKMSEKFAYDEKTNKSYHFVMEVEDTGLWHTYLIAINEKEYDKYKDVIDYTYERIKTPQKLKIYGYPILINEDLKNLAIKNIKKFVPIDNQIEITDENFEKYLTNSYLDTTMLKKDDFNYILFSLVMILVIIFALFIYTIFHKEKKITKKKKTKKSENIKKEKINNDKKETKIKLDSKNSKEQQKDKKKKDEEEDIEVI